jgi:adenylate kinase
MTDDIVARLRGLPLLEQGALCAEAAEKIERMREALRLLIEWHEDTGAVMLDVLLDVARAAYAEEAPND